MDFESAMQTFAEAWVAANKDKDNKDCNKDVEMKEQKEDVDKEVEEEGDDKKKEEEEEELDGKKEERAKVGAWLFFGQKMSVVHHRRGHGT